MTEQFSFETLTPTAFLDRSARVFRDDLAMVDGDVRRTYAELRDRCLRQSGMLHALGIEPGDRVAVLAPNTSLMLEAHYGVLYAGAVLVSLNTRLTAPELRFILEHSGSRVLLVEESLADLAREATADLPSITVVGDDYEDKLAAARHRYVPLADERTMIALNYTSGTTGDPKGVMYHARGAYLQALAMVAHFGLDSGSTYLWTLPMFHCNGWTFTWPSPQRVARTCACPRSTPSGSGISSAPRTSRTCAARDRSRVAGRRPECGRIDHRVVAAIGGAPPAPASSSGAPRSDSTSRTCTGSPRRTARRRSASGVRSGTSSPRTRRHGCAHGRAWATSWPANSASSTRWDPTCPPTARRPVKSRCAATT